LWIYDDVEMGLRNSFFVYLPTYGEWIEIINGTIYDKYTQVHGLTAGMKNNDEVVLKSDSRVEIVYLLNWARFVCTGVRLMRILRLLKDIVGIGF
jgi:hypothetical protein